MSTVAEKPRVPEHVSQQTPAPQIQYQTTALADNNIPTLLASLKEYTRNLRRHMTEAVYIYMTKLYVQAVKDVKDKKAAYEGPYADLKWFQVKLRDILKWNDDQVKEAAEDVLSHKKGWRFQQVLKSIFHIKSMVQASIRPVDMTDSVFVGIPSPEAFIHRVLILVAQMLFAYPSLMRVTRHDDEEDVVMNRERVYRYIHESIDNALTDLMPTDQIMDMYVSRALQAVKNTEPRKAAVTEDLSRYGFEQRIDDVETEGEEDEEESGSEYDDEETEYEDGDETELSEEEEEEEPPRRSRHHQQQRHEQRHENKPPTPVTDANVTAIAPEADTSIPPREIPKTKSQIPPQLLRRPSPARDAPTQSNDHKRGREQQQHRELDRRDTKRRHH